MWFIIILQDKFCNECSRKFEGVVVQVITRREETNPFILTAGNLFYDINEHIINTLKCMSRVKEPVIRLLTHFACDIHNGMYIITYRGPL